MTLNDLKQGTISFTITAFDLVRLRKVDMTSTKASFLMMKFMNLVWIIPTSTIFTTGACAYTVDVIKELLVACDLLIAILQPATCCKATGRFINAASHHLSMSPSWRYSQHKEHKPDCWLTSTSTVL